MYIFIDESGLFIRPPSGNGLSVAGALIVPERRLSALEARYRRLRPELPKRKGEVKGSKLTETQVAKVIEILRHNEVLVDVVAIDMNDHEAAEIEEHKRLLVRSIVDASTNARSPAFRDETQKLATQISGLTSQLYVQSFVMFELIWRAFEIG